MIKKYVTDLKTEFKGYNARRFSGDLMAGITVAAVALPLALAFGVSSGATASSGLLTAIIGGFIISLFGGAFYQISGPTGAMAAILMSIIAAYGMSGVFTATLIAGILLVLAGIFKLGKLTAFIPMPVITGFTSGIAVIIALGQLDNFFGVSSVGSSAVEKLISYFTHGFSPNLTSVLIGALVVVFMIVFPKKWNAIVPSSLLAIIFATAATIIFSLPTQTVGQIPATLLLDERFSFSMLNLESIKGLISPAISIAALGMVESLLCGASAGRMTGVKLDSNRELVAQGLGNIAVVFFGGIPATAAIARTSVAIKSGAQTRLTGIIHSIVLLVSMLLLGPVMSSIPLSALAGVLLVTAFRMNEWHTIKYMFKNKFKGAILKFFVTMIATILFDLTIAIIIGVVVGLVLLAIRVTNLGVSVDKDGASATVHIQGAAIFSNTEKILDIYDEIHYYSDITFSLENTSHIDISGVSALLELIELLKKEGSSVAIQNASESVSIMLKRGGVYESL